MSSPRASPAAGRGQPWPAASQRSKWPTTARHIIQVTQEGGETAEFDDRPARFLVMDRNPVTKALEPVIIRGEPLYYYLAREIGGRGQ